MAEKYLISHSFCTFSEWKATVTRYTVELQSSKLKGAREDVIKLLRSKASIIYTEVSTIHFHFHYSVSNEFVQISEFNRWFFSFSLYDSAVLGYIINKWIGHWYGTDWNIEHSFEWHSNQSRCALVWIDLQICLWEVEKRRHLLDEFLSQFTISKVTTWARVL